MTLARVEGRRYPLLGYRGKAPAPARRPKPPHAPFAESPIPPKQLTQPQRKRQQSSLTKPVTRPGSRKRAPHQLPYKGALQLSAFIPSGLGLSLSSEINSGVSGREKIRSFRKIG